MNTDEHRPVLLTAKFLVAWKKNLPESSWERTPLACMWWPLDRRLHAGSVRSQESGPVRVPVVKSLVAAWPPRTTNRQILGRLERNFSQVFLGAHASGVHVVAVGSPFARWKRALPGIRAARGLCGEIFGCGYAALCYLAEG